MKLKFLLVGMLAVAAGLQSCDRTTKEEKRKAKVFNDLYAAKDSVDVAFGSPVDNTLAQECINHYSRIYGPLNPSAAKLQEAYSDYVRFGNKGMLQWMFNMADSTDVNNMRVYFGVYTEKIAKAYPDYNIQPGRLTVFIWPYNGNKKAIYKKFTGHVGGPDTVGPYDAGELRP